MHNKIYDIVEMPNGLKMMALLPINETGIAKAYCTIRDNPMGYSEGACGPFSCNIYKKFGLENGIKDFELCCNALNVNPNHVITNRLTALTNIVRIVDTNTLNGYDIYDEVNAPRADGLITNSTDICLFNYAADCAIIMFVDPQNQVIGSLHASWKGSLLGIIENEVKGFKDNYGSDPADLIAVVMPSISVEYFEVGMDCAEQFVQAGFSEFIDTTSYEKPHIDLSKVNQAILIKCGLNKDHIHVIDDLCTYRDEKTFHSFRRGPIDEEGRHLNGMNGYFVKFNN